MPTDLSALKPGDTIYFVCPHKGCEKARLTAVIADSFIPHPDYKGKDRFPVAASVRIMGFSLAQEVKCPCCQRIFTCAIMIPRGARRPIIWGEELKEAQQPKSEH